MFKQTILLQISESLSFTNFTWFILEYFVPNNVTKTLLQLQRVVEQLLNDAWVLTRFMLLVSSYTPWKHQKTRNTKWVKAEQPHVNNNQNQNLFWKFLQNLQETWGRQRWLQQATSEQMFFFEYWEVFKSISFTEYFCVSNSERCYLWKRIRELTDINYYFKLFKVLNISFFLRYCIRQPQKMVGFWSAAG